MILMKVNKSPIILCGLILFVFVVLPSYGGVGEGKALYDAYCQICHGGLGEGQTMGKPLTDNVANRMSDDQLLSIITNGRSGTGMAAWGSSLSEEEIFDIATYVRVLQGRPGLDIVNEQREQSNDPLIMAGEALFNGQAGCATCHSYNNEGGSIGPALDGVSARLADNLELALLDPSANILAGYEVKIVEQSDGSTIRGRFRNDSELAVQIQSEDGRRWVTYFKDRVKSVSDSDRSLMPEIYATLGLQEREQLIAFLRSL